MAAAADDEIITDDPDAQEELAHQLGTEGGPTPKWVKGNVRNHAAYRRGRGEYHQAVRSASQRRHAVPGVVHQLPVGPRPAARGGVSADDTLARRERLGSARDASLDAVGRSFSPTAAVKARSAGDAGGLLLILVLYPLALATVKYGANGPGMWFRAKWLNQTTDKPKDTLGPAAATTPIGQSTVVKAIGTLGGTIPPTAPTTPAKTTAGGSR